MKYPFSFDALPYPPGPAPQNCPGNGPGASIGAKNPQNLPANVHFPAALAWKPLCLLMLGQSGANTPRICFYLLLVFLGLDKENEI